MTLLTDDVTRHHAKIPALDGLRALAIVIVMCSHLGLQQIVPGQFGVTLFFFLSGYLITTLLRQEIEAHGRIDLGRFYLRRIVRILPPMYLTIAFFMVLSAVGLLHPLNWHALPVDFAFLSNYLPISGTPIGLWSLAVEEHFYLAFPLLLGLLARRFSFAQCAAIFLALCGVVLVVRLWEVHRLADFSQVNFWTHTRIDSILFGSILALWNNPVADRGDVVSRGTTGYLMAAALLLPTFVIRDDAFRQTYRYTVQGLGLMVLFNTLIRERGWASKLFNNPVTGQIAILSYTLYLVHSGLIAMLVPADGGHAVARKVIAIALAFVYAIAMHRLVERPLNRWRRKVERSGLAAATWVGSSR
ncbi:MAG: acyltransferase [Sphingomonas sp.]|uniref:acyltransferase family protein n=1 Tax=Sphingomonas sp. TaxID=28214 RepID=UPI001AC2E47D|nr:acyltransferase [Sphingomonas sp.]MBN8808852.1 acyltransferase [Sphingomonas sp.]